ncbi:MAG: protein kinase, partial [Myxococcales bacterium]|nr:protein kinase [Myxococcales bacterium]
MSDGQLPASACLRVEEVRYELVRRIGGGSLGEVYIARASTGWLESMVCVKRLAALADLESARALREEARVLSRIRHANVISLLAVGQDGEGTPFLVLELVDGVDLHALTHRLRERGERLADGVAV